MVTIQWNMQFTVIADGSVLHRRSLEPVDHRICSRGTGVNRLEQFHFLQKHPLLIMFLRLNPRNTQVRPFSYWWAPRVSVHYPSSSPFPSDVALEQQHCSVRGGGGEGHALGRIGGVRVSKENKRDEEEGGMSMTSGPPLSGF
jgi:hypothetical protein